MLLIGGWWLTGVTAQVLARSVQTVSQSHAGGDLTAGLQALHDATVLRLWAAGMTMVGVLLGLVIVCGIWRRQVRLAGGGSSAA